MARSNPLAVDAFAPSPELKKMIANEFRYTRSEDDHGTGYEVAQAPNFGDFGERFGGEEDVIVRPEASRSLAVNPMATQTPPPQQDRGDPGKGLRDIGQWMFGPESFVDALVDDWREFDRPGSAGDPQRDPYLTNPNYPFGQDYEPPSRMGEQRIHVFPEQVPLDQRVPSNLEGFVQYFQTGPGTYTYEKFDPRPDAQVLAPEPDARPGPAASGNRDFDEPGSGPPGPGPSGGYGDESLPPLNFSQRPADPNTIIRGVKSPEEGGWIYTDPSRGVGTPPSIVPTPIPTTPTPTPLPADLPILLGDVFKSPAPATTAPAAVAPLPIAKPDRVYTPSTYTRPVDSSSGDDRPIRDEESELSSSRWSNASRVGVTDLDTWAAGSDGPRTASTGGYDRFSGVFEGQPAKGWETSDGRVVINTLDRQGEMHTRLLDPDQAERNAEHLERKEETIGSFFENLFSRDRD